MDIGLEVLVPSVILLGLLISLLLGLMCKFHICRTSAKSTAGYKPLNQGGEKANGYPMMPTIKSRINTVQCIQPSHEDQFIRCGEISETRRTGSISNIHDRLLASRGSVSSISQEMSSISSDCSNSDSWLPRHSVELQSPINEGDDLKYYESKLQNSRSRFVSDPMLYQGKANVTMPINLRSRRHSYATKPIRKISESLNNRRQSIPPLGNKTRGVIEFSLNFIAERKLLEVNVMSLKDMQLTPENFDGVLETYDNDARRPRNKIHLVRNSDSTLTFSENFHIGYMIYMMLLPKRNFNNHTQLVFESGDVMFNETFTLSGYSVEQLSTSTLCFHSLCSFSGEEELMVLGESKIVLNKEKFEQRKFFQMQLNPAVEVVKIRKGSLKTVKEIGSLKVHLMFNPLAHKLAIKVVQANALPGIGVSGLPNTSVKTSFYHCKMRVSKKSTPIQKRQRNPIYNTTMEFDASEAKIKECDVLFEIRHHGPMRRNIIGYVHVGSSAAGEGGKHWSDMQQFQRPQTTHKILPKRPSEF